VLPASCEMPSVPFLPFAIFLGILGVLCVGLTSFWAQHWLGGFAWDGSSKMFNWHPVLMVTGITNKTIPYAKLPTEAWFANSLGMLILVFGLLVLWALATPTWKRPDVNLQEIQEVKNDAGL
ncbi:hypothetical protein lerEdw1_007430, partial [Lerista edwardsae]